MDYFKYLLVFEVLYISSIISSASATFQPEYRNIRQIPFLHSRYDIPSYFGYNPYLSQGFGGTLSASEAQASSQSGSLNGQTVETTQSGLQSGTVGYQGGYDSIPPVYSPGYGQSGYEQGGYNPSVAEQNLALPTSGANVGANSQAAAGAQGGAQSGASNAYSPNRPSVSRPGYGQGGYNPSLAEQNVASPASGANVGANSQAAAGAQGGAQSGASNVYSPNGPSVNRPGYVQGGYNPSPVQPAVASLTPGVGQAGYNGQSGSQSGAQAAAQSGAQGLSQNGVQGAAQSGAQAATQSGSAGYEGSYNPTSNGYNPSRPSAGQAGYGQSGYNSRPAAPIISEPSIATLPVIPLSGVFQTGGGSQTNSFTNSESHNSQNSQNINVEALGIPIVNIGLSNSNSNSHSNSGSQSQSYNLYNQYSQYG